MRIAYFVNSFNAINWGGQATSAGLKTLVRQTYPDAEFVPLEIPGLPFRHFRFRRDAYSRKLAHAILRDDPETVQAMLEKLGILPDLFDGFDTVCFNGEGAIHSKSGHLFRLMGMLYCFKRRGAFVSALNQTVDLGPNALAREVIKRVYQRVDYVAAREPVSQRELIELGVSAELMADAAYALPRLTPEQIERHTDGLDLPERFIGITGSSALRKTSTPIMDYLLMLIAGHYRMPLVFLANAKTDIALADKLKQKHGLMVIKPPVRYEQAMAVIARAHLIVGGRQHPNIFAAMHHVPFVPFRGNTHKMQGVVELLGYPLSVLPWERDKAAILNQFSEADRLYDSLRDIEAPYPKTICLS